MRTADQNISHGKEKNFLTDVWLETLAKRSEAVLLPLGALIVGLLTFGLFLYFLGKSPFSLVRHARFRSALKLLELRVKLDEVKIETVVWWDKFHKCPDSEKIQMINVMRSKTGQRRSYKKRKKKRLSTI